MKTHEEKLQAITADIREKLPRLKEISKGDFVKGNLIIGLSLDVYLVYSYIKEKVYEVPISEMSEIFEGKEPMLNDVLKWLSRKGKNAFWEFKVNCLGDLFEFDFEEYKFQKLAGIKWDLSKSFLKDQDQYLIDFLYERI